MKINRNFNVYLHSFFCVIFLNCGGGSNDKGVVVEADSLANINLNESSTNVDSVKNQTVAYKTVSIGSQTWMVENISVDVFLNGDTIPQAKSINDWLRASQNKEPAWCYYEDSAKDSLGFGKLYNWYAVNDKRGLVPIGWRVPARVDFEQLVKNLGGQKIAAAKLKSINAWVDNGKGTNETGFNALPSGMRQFNGGFSNRTTYSYFWSSTERAGENAWYFGLSDKNSIAKTFFSQKGNGFSLRCIQN